MKYSISRSCLFFLPVLMILTLFVWEAHAQSPRFYSTQHGLVNTRIWDIQFDRNNFLWIATDMGLSRFDGQSFTTFAGDKDNPTAMQSSRVSAIYEDAAKRHWVGASDGLYYFCRTENRFTHYYLSPDSLESGISTILSHPQDPTRLLIATFGAGIYEFDTESCQCDHTRSRQLSALLHKQNVQHMLIDRNNRLWVINPEGIQVIDYNTMQTASLYGDIATLDIIGKEVFHSILEDRNRPFVYLGSLQNGLLCCDLNTMTVRKVCADKTSGLNITALQQAPDGSILLGTENKGLFQYTPENGQLELLQYHNSPIDLEHSKIHGLEYDRYGNLWLGLFQKGILVLPNRQNIFTYQPAAITPDGNNLGCVSCFAIQNDGTRLIGMDGAGLLVYAPNGKTCHYNTENSILQTNAVLAMASDTDDRVFIGTYNYGVYCYEKGEIKRIAGLEKLNNMRVMTLAYDSLAQHLYIGTSGNGVYQYNCRNEALTSLYNETYNQWVISLFLDKQRWLWVGTEDDVLHIDVDCNHIDIISDQSDNDIYAHGFTESDNAIWMTSHKGLWHYQKASGELRFIANDNAHTGEVILSVLYHHDNHVWFSTNYGLGTYDINKSLFRNYQSEELHAVGSFSAKSAFCWPDSTISFGGDNGYLSFNPDNVYANSHNLNEIFFNRLWVNNVPTDYNPNASDNMLDAALWYATQLTLPTDANSFSIGFSVLGYSDPIGIRYAYRLAGYDNLWHEVHGTDMNANYSHLPCGTYQLQIRAMSNEDGTEATLLKELKIVVSTPWFRQPWAYAVYIFLLITIIIYIVLHLRARAHQKRVLVRTEHNRQIKEAKLRLFTSMSHEIKTPLTLILSPLRKLMEKNVDNATASVYDLMYRNALRILMLVNQQMDIRKIDNGQLHLHMREVSISAFLSDIMQYFNHLALSHAISFTIQPDKTAKDLTVWLDPEHLDKVFFNLLSNAFKFTERKGTVSITIQTLKNKQIIDNAKVQDVVAIQVFNSGSGVEASDITHIFERFYQGKNSQENVGSGIGLHLAQELVELHHGKITVENLANRGVTFTVYLPLGNKHLSEEEIANSPTPQTSRHLAQELIPQSRELQTADILPDEPTAANNNKNTSVQTSVLLVDDNKELVAYLQQELAEFNVSIAYSGHSAWTQLLTTKPDVVVTDVKMPDGDGLELCQRIKKNPDTNNIPVIVLTSETSELMAEEVMQCQADRFLTKPVNTVLLKGAIQQSLKLRKDIINKMRRSEINYDYNHIRVSSSDDKLLQRVIEVIRKNIDNAEFSVEELSAEVGLSRVHLNRKLKELIGTSPSTLIKSIRMKQAAYLLVNNNVTVAEIAYSVGFSTPSYFTSNFSAYFGMTPTEFVVNYLANPNDEKLNKLLE